MVKVQAAVDVVRNAVALMFSTVASAGLGMLFWVVAARLYDVDDVGRAAAAVSAITLLGGLAQLSLHAVFIRFLPTAGEATGRFIGVSYFASGSVAIILAVAFYVLMPSARFLPPGPVALGAFSLAVVAASFSGLQDSVLTALRRTTWVPVENITIAIGKLGLLPVLASGAVVAPVIISWGAPVVAAVLVLSVAIFFRLAPIQARRLRGRSALPSQRELLTFLSAQNLTGILANLTAYLPPLLVTLVLGPEQSGLFYVPWLIGTSLFALSWNVLVSLVVEASTDPTRIRLQLRHALRLLLLVTVGGGTALALGAPLILSVLGGRYTHGGAESLRLIGLALPFSVIGTMFSVTGYMAKKAWGLFFASLASAVIFLGGAYVAMTRLGYGIEGAAGAYCASEVVLAFVLLPITVRRLRALVRTSDLETTVIPRVRPGYDTGPMQVIFLPAEVIDWERLGQIDTVLMDRLPESGSEMTIPFRRLSSSDTTVLLPKPGGEGYAPADPAWPEPSSGR